MHTDLDSYEPVVTQAPRTTRRFGLLGLVLVFILIGLFAAGYLPRRKRQAELAAGASEAAARNRHVNVVAVHRSALTADTTLPGSIQAIDETPIYARADGYLTRRLVDIGDRVRAGQLLAEIESPELDQQIRQARAAIDESQASVLRARANLAQAQANLKLADLSLKRWSVLVAKGVLSKQEGDQKQSDYDAQVANVRAAEAAITAADSAVRSSQANLQRLLELKGFCHVTAPFAGVITARNVDVGALITSGSSTSARQLFNLAQIDRLRIFVNVPQSFAPSVHVGETAEVAIQELPGKVSHGAVTRTANSLDQASHTLLTEVQVANPLHQLLPGMYAQVSFVLARPTPPLMIPSDALIVHRDGSYALTVGEDSAVHYHKVTLGRDYGASVEIASGLSGGEYIIVSPTDDLKEGQTVDATLR
jgi:RND family efflux transporter MFP subunit